jgi:uncharacterized membrane protein HdeD (DUF308 family)
MKSARTTIGGILAAIASAVLANGLVPVPYVWIASLVQAIALVLLGVAAADKSKLPPTPVR